MPIRDVTAVLNEELGKHADIAAAFGLIASCGLFGRETRSAALGEISEHLVARIVAGTRRPTGSKGFDVVDPQGLGIEVKSRLTGRWGDGLMFDFSSHTSKADRVYCLTWLDKPGTSKLHAAFEIPVDVLVSEWDCPGSIRYCARTTLGKVRAAWQAQQAPGASAGQGLGSAEPA